MPAIFPGLGGSVGEWRNAMHALALSEPTFGELPTTGSCVAFGHSMGGIDALRAAAAHPLTVRGLVLTSSFYPPARAGRGIGTSAADYGRHRVLYLRDLARRGRAPRPTQLGARRLARLAALGIRPGVFHELVARVTCPVRVIHGQQDHVVPVAFARAAAARHPAWVYDEIAGVGHFPHRDQPETWADLVRPWIDQLPAWT
jgi:pimeloyl-ACP methyl ester carboxylesterase